MEKIKSQLFFICCILLITGLFLMDIIRVLPSLSMIAIALLGIYHWVKTKSGNLFSSKVPFLLVTLCFFALLPSYFYSENFSYYSQKLQLAIPFLVLPLAFLKIPPLNRIRYLQLLAFFVAVTFIICLFAFVNYLANQEMINELYLHSKVMPTLVSHHPTFSIMIVFAIYLAYYLYSEKDEVLLKGEKKAYLLIGIFLFIFIHVFSVRSGILSLYVLLMIEILKLIFQKKQLKLALYIGLTLLLVGALTMYLSPTVSNKIANTSSDLKAINKQESANNKSLSSRLISYQNALEINEASSFWWGCGLGDVEDLNNAIFAEKYPDVTKPIIPHNQFLYYFAAIGFIGLILFIVGFFGAWIWQKSYKDSVLFTHLVLCLLYFMVESPLVTQIGVAYILVFLLLGLHQKLAKHP